MSLASDFAALITVEDVNMAAAEALRPAPFVGPLVTISVQNDGSAQIKFGTNTYPAPAAAAFALGQYLVATFGP